MMSPAVTSLSSLLTLSPTMKSSSFSTFDGWELERPQTTVGRPSEIYNPPLSLLNKVKNFRSHATVNELPADWLTGRDRMDLDRMRWQRVIESRWLSEDINTQTGCGWMWVVGMLGRQEGGQTKKRRTICYQKCPVVLWWVVSLQYRYMSNLVKDHPFLVHYHICRKTTANAFFLYI